MDDEEDLAAFVKRPDVFGWAWNYNPIHDGSGVMSYEGAAFSNGDFNCASLPDST